MKPPKKPAAAKINKSAFVRSLPASMSATDAVKAAAAKGIKLSDKFVHTIRYNAKVAAQKKASKSGSAPVATASTASTPTASTAARGPGRPRKVVAAAGGAWTSSGLVGEIERIVEAKVNALLKERLGALLGG
jgi:hypothetical protein